MFLPFLQGDIPCGYACRFAKLMQTMHVIWEIGLQESSAPNRMVGPLNGALNQISYGVRPSAKES